MSQVKESFWNEFVEYVSQFRVFSKGDWQYYICWIGLMMGLFISTTAFLLMGHFHGVRYPAYVWNIPIGTATFILAIALDTIGHRTRYKERLDKGEGFVHTITIFLGISSIVLLCLGYSRPDFFRIPALVFMAMSIFYSIVDEWMHWGRYVAGESDRVEMWSHVFIFLGHIIMSLAWWHWFEQGYPGVSATLFYF
ncbi:MAG: hypothetical protein ACKVQC_04295 [Elusimicrobiota bacterium]